MGPNSLMVVYVDPLGTSAIPRKRSVWKSGKECANFCVHVGVVLHNIFFI